MSLSDMQIFNEYLMPATIETLDQVVELFNAASNGTILLTTAGFDGSFLEESFFNALHSAQRRVDRLAANGAAGSTNLSQGNHSSVKIAGGFGPIKFEPSQLTWLRQDPDVAVEVISRNLAEAITQDQLNTAIAALVAAISNNTGTVVDVSGGAQIDQGVLNQSHALFGDRSMMLQGQVMTGTTYHKLIGDAITNDNRLFEAQGVTIVNILNKPVIVTDAPALREVGPPAKQKVLSLASSAAVVSDGSDLITNIDTTNGNQRIETTMQADYTFGLGLKGYTWDQVNGGQSPTDADIATGTNWDQSATYLKATAGVVAIGDEAPTP